MFGFRSRRSRAAGAGEAAGAAAAAGKGDSTPARAEAGTAAVAAAAAAAPAGDRPRFDAERILRRLEWTVVRRLDGVLQGDYRTLFRGFGLDLADLREYQSTDDVRYIDWNATARLQAPYVREFQEDREVAAWFLLDLSGSIDFGSGGVRKREVSVELVGALARLFTRAGNRVGAILYSDRTETVIPAANGRRHVLHVMDRIHAVGRKAATRETDLAELVERAHSTIRRRSVIFVVSDFISKPGWAKPLATLAARHEVIAVRLFDPLEVELPDLGLVVMQDAETGEQMFVDTHDPKFRARFTVAAHAREQALREALGEAGVDCLEVSTDERIDEALLAFVRLRKWRSRLAGGAPTLASS